MKIGSHKGGLIVAKVTPLIIKYSMIDIMELLGFTCHVPNLYGDAPKPIIKSWLQIKHLCFFIVTVHLFLLLYCLYLTSIQ